MYLLWLQTHSSNSFVIYTDKKKTKQLRIVDKLLVIYVVKTKMYVVQDWFH